jgi:hypothetical protein
VAILFDTLKLADRLESAGFNREQAHGLTAALGEATSDQLVTKADLAELKAELLKWMFAQTFVIIGMGIALKVLG